jgi:hypothetical protein
LRSTSARSEQNEQSSPNEGMPQPRQLCPDDAVSLAEKAELPRATKSRTKLSFVPGETLSSWSSKPL